MTHYTNQPTEGGYQIFGPIGQTKLLTSTRSLYIAISLLFSFTAANAQIPLTWLGTVSSEFHNQFNWFPVSDPTNQLLIINSNGNNAPVISTSVSVFGVLVGANADLTIRAGGTLNIHAVVPTFTAQGIFFNEGTVLNQGTINISSTSIALEPYTINNEGSFTNESTFPGGNLSRATINILNSNGVGIQSSGPFVNRGATINIGTTGTISGDGIVVDDDLFSTRSISIGGQSTGVINIDNTNEDGLELKANGRFTISSGEINIGSNNTIGNYGIDNEGTFSCNGGTIDIDDTGWSGMRNRQGASFNNTDAIISIGNNNNLGHGIRNEGTIVNNKTINIKRAVNDGINNNSGGQFTNNAAGSITIGSTQAVGEFGILNRASGITNYGNINIKSTMIDGINNIGINSNFDNLAGGVINIGTNGGTIGRMGIWNINEAMFTNNASTINIGNTGGVNPPIGRGIANSGTFVNENGGLLAIGQNSESTASSGIICDGVSQFTNENSTIRIDNVGESGIQIWEDSGFHNHTSGRIDIGQNQGNVGGSGLFVIGTFTNGNNGILNIDRVGVSAVDMQQGGNVVNLSNSQINIGLNGGVNTIDVYGFSAFGTLRNNNSTINVNNTTYAAIFLAQGFVYNENNGNINIGTSGVARNIRGIGIECAAQFENISGTIRLRNISQSGIVVEPNADFINGSNGVINIGTNGTRNNINNNGIQNKGIFQNNGGSIIIEQTGDNGILMNGVNNPYFISQSGGDIRISNTDDAGLKAESGSFDNKGVLTIGHTDGQAIWDVSGNILQNDMATGVFKVDGTVQGLFDIDGTIAPGNSPGEFVNNQALDISDATLDIEINGSTPVSQHDVLDVRGQATISNATLTVTINYTPATNDRIVFLKASSISGTFATPVLPDYWELDYSVSGEVALVYNDLSCLLSAKIFLQGPYNTSTALLNDDLRTTVIMPLVEPYSAMSGFTHVNGGGETIGESILNVSGNNAMVDWIFVELRDATNPSIVLHTRAAILQRDGDIVDISGGNAPVVFPLAPIGDYYVAIRHRNHMSIRTTSPISLDKATTTAYDFTSASAQANGTDPMVEVSTGVWAMWGGNAKSDDNYVRVTPRVFPPPSLASDRTYILDDILNGNPNGTFTGYSNGDINMDGHVRLTPRVFPPPSLESDATFILDEVLDGDPNGTRTEQ